MDSSQDHDNEQIPSLEGVQESISSPDLPTETAFERAVNAFLAPLAPRERSQKTLQEIRSRSDEISSFIHSKTSRLESHLDSGSLALGRDSTPKSSELDESHPSRSWPPGIYNYIPSISSFKEENEPEASGSQVQSHQPAHSAEAASSPGDDHVRFPSAKVVSKLTTNRQPHHPYRKKTKV